jgi:hypothetical protein
VAMVGVCPRARRYTQFVSIHSRPVYARLDMLPLASALNRCSSARQSCAPRILAWLHQLQIRMPDSPAHHLCEHRADVGREQGVEWVSNSMVDTGPLLR